MQMHCSLPDRVGKSSEHLGLPGTGGSSSGVVDALLALAVEKE